MAKNHTTLQNLAGQQFGRLTVIEQSGNRGGRVWLCVCSCGNHRHASTSQLNSPGTHSCGCFNREFGGSHKATHRKSRTRIYRIWIHMKARCLNPKRREYKDYGGRGITVCARWLESFESFYADMGPLPTPEHTLERIDNDGDYAPENCKWATRREQGGNRRNTIKINYQGRSMILADWARELGIAEKPLWRRLKRGWTVEQAFTLPLGTHLSSLRLRKASGEEGC